MKIFDPKLTGSIAFENAVQGNFEITGDLVVPGSITAREFKTELVSASIIYQSGSTQFGNSADDTHIFTGNVGIGADPSTYNLRVREDQAGESKIRVENQSNSADAYATFQLSSYGNTWGIRHGSTAANSNSLEFVLDSGGNNFNLFKINSNGNVGINRETPSYRLDVGGGSGFRDTLRVLANDVNTVNLSWTATNTGLVNLYHGGTLTTQLIANGTSYFNGGNVGIGTVSADTKLQVNVGGNGIRHYSDSNNILTTYVGSNYQIFEANNNGVTSQFGYGLGDFYIQTAGTETLRVDSQNSPTLSIKATQGSYNSTADLALWGTNSNAYGGSVIARSVVSSITDGTAYGSKLRFYTTDTSNTLTKRMVIDSAGKVGIGTATPEDGLHVYGPGNGKGLTVEATDGQVEAAAIKLYPKAISANERNWAIAAYRHSSEDLSFTSGNAKGDDPYTTGTTRLLIDGINGYVGIGNTNPVRKLVISNNGANGIELDPNIAGNSEIISYNRSTSSYTPLHFEASRFAFLNGNVGIANTSPTDYSGYKMLHIGDGTVGNTGIIKLGTGSTANGPELYAATVGGVNRLLLNTDSSTNVMVLNGSNVGIGTDSPETKLHIVANTTNSQFILERIGTATGKYKFYTNNNSLWIYDEAQTSHRMMINSVGQVGIGTTAPSNKVHIEQNTDGDLFLEIDNQNTGASASAGLLLRGQGNNFFLRNYGDGTSNANITEFKSTAGGSQFVFSTASTERMRINSVGNVGIGTTAPAYPLHIYDTDDSPLLLEGANQWTGIKWKDQSGEDWMWFNGSTQTFAIGGGGSSSNSNKKLHVEGAVSVGVGFNNEPLRNNSLSVRTSVRIDDADINWYQNTIPDGIAYWHLKTDMWGGGSPSGNIDHTMSLFTGRAYFYSPSMILEGSVGFHNWSGTIYNPYTTGNLFSTPYVSSDGYVVLVINSSGRTYGGLSIDWYQSYQYPYRLKQVVATAGHSATTGAF